MVCSGDGHAGLGFAAEIYEKARIIEGHAAFHQQAAQKAQEQLEQENCLREHLEKKLEWNKFLRLVSDLKVKSAETELAGAREDAANAETTREAAAASAETMRDEVVTLRAQIQSQGAQIQAQGNDLMQVRRGYANFKAGAYTRPLSQLNLSRF